MTVVSDTSPLNYLTLIGLSHLLPALFGQVLIPEAVQQELTSAGAPQPVRTWLASHPPWLDIRLVSAIPADLRHLGPGERAAITLTETVGSGLVLLDELKARQVARHRGLLVSGTLGVLDLAGGQGLVDVRDALDQLRRTTFRVSPTLFRWLHERHR